MNKFKKQLNIVLTPEDHLIINADNSIYDVLESGVHHSFEEYVDPIYRENFRKKVSAADGNWFPARIISDNGSFLYYVSARLERKTNNIRVSLIGIDELIAEHSDLLEMVTTLRSQLSLFDDIFFIYDPDTKTLTLSNTQAADYDAGSYSLDKAEAMLCQKVNPSEQDSVRSFIGQVKSKAGRFSTRIEGNLINSDPDITTTLLEACHVYFPSGIERVAGHIHPESSRHSVKVTSIK